MIAQSGEGSVRDSLSALDQAIACCGNKLEAAAVRALLGAFGSSHGAGDRPRCRSGWWACSALVDELERNGGSPQHFSRELSRYLRNLLVTKIAGGDSRLIAASPAERGETDADCGGVRRRRSDALSAAFARSVPRLAVFAATAVSSGDRAAEDGAGGQVGCRLKRRWRVWPPPALRPSDRRAHSRAVAPRHRRNGPSPSRWTATRRPAGPRPSLSGRPPPAPSTTGARNSREPWSRRACSFPPTPSAIRVALVNNELIITAPKLFQLDLGREEILTALKQLGQPGLRFKVSFGEVKRRRRSALKPAPRRMKSPDARWRTRKCNVFENCLAAKCAPYAT